jgi:glycosyltransferase involved in cell wall biosynthesis
MNIAVNTRFLLKDDLEGVGYFTKEVLRILVTQYPQHQFYFFFDRPYDPGFIFSANVHPVVIGPQARHPVLWKLWFDVKVPAALKKIAADVFVSPDSYCSLTTKVPQCVVVHDLGFLHFPEAYKKSHGVYLRHYMPKFLKKATAIATVSQFSKDDLIKHYRTKPEKISIVYSAVKDSFAPLSLDRQTAIKEKYTGGKEFFLYVGAIQPRKNLVNLLKAFSIFKKRQQSSMKLVLAGRLAWKTEEFRQLMNTYKYKDEVLLTGYLPEPELAQLIGASYALVYPSLFEGFGVPVLEAMKCGVPALTSQNTSMQEIGGDAGLYFDPADHNDMADKLMLIYKDEGLRSKLIEKGKEAASHFSWQRTADLLWESLTKASGSSSVE